MIRRIMVLSIWITLLSLWIVPVLVYAAGPDGRRHQPRPTIQMLLKDPECIAECRADMKGCVRSETAAVKACAEGCAEEVRAVREACIADPLSAACEDARRAARACLHPCHEGYRTGVHECTDLAHDCVLDCPEVDVVDCVRSCIEGRVTCFAEARAAARACRAECRTEIETAREACRENPESDACRAARAAARECLRPCYKELRSDLRACMGGLRECLADCRNQETPPTDQ